MTTRVLIVEDLSASRAFLVARVREVFGTAQIDEASGMRAALTLCARHTYQLALVDIGLPDGDGYEVLRRLSEPGSETLAIVTTVMGSDSAIVAALSAGAGGYILKSDPPALIERHLQMIGDGVPPLSPAIARRVMEHFRATGPAVDAEGALTPREGEVLSLIARGLRVADAAQVLDLAPSTVASHIKAIYRKLGISSRAEATYQAARLGLIARRD